MELSPYRLVAPQGDQLVPCVSVSNEYVTSTGVEASTK